MDLSFKVGYSLGLSVGLIAIDLILSFLFSDEFTGGFHLNSQILSIVSFIKGFIFIMWMLVKNLQGDIYKHVQFYPFIPQILSMFFHQCGHLIVMLYYGFTPTSGKSMSFQIKNSDLIISFKFWSKMLVLVVKSIRFAYQNSCTHPRQSWRFFIHCFSKFLPNLFFHLTIQKCIF